MHANRLAEHILSMVSIIIRVTKAEPGRDPVQELFKQQIPMVFTLTELNWWKAILSKWFNIVVTFAWSFMDLFVMLVSVGLASQFKQINSDLQLVRGRVTNCFLPYISFSMNRFFPMWFLVYTR